MAEKGKLAHPKLNQTQEGKTELFYDQKHSSDFEILIVCSDVHQEPFLTVSQ